MISTDGEVELQERMWMTKLCESNEQASELAGQLLCPDTVSYTHLTLPTILLV